MIMARFTVPLWQDIRESDFIPVYTSIGINLHRNNAQKIQNGI